MNLRLLGTILIILSGTVFISTKYERILYRSSRRIRAWVRLRLRKVNEIKRSEILDICVIILISLLLCGYLFSYLQTPPTPAKDLVSLINEFKNLDEWFNDFQNVDLSSV